jgi:uncharacterized membrane protein YdcZ (DUF606 family)
MRLLRPAAGARAKEESMNDVPWWAWMWGAFGTIVLAYVGLLWAMGSTDDWPDDY